MGGHHERPRPGRFSRMVVAYPVAVMMASGGIAIVLAMLAFTAGESELGGSFTDTEDPIVRKLYGFLAMRHDYWTDTGREEDERRRLGEAAPRRRPRSSSRRGRARTASRAPWARWACPCSAAC